jgi:uncharacterized protein YqjF (DUF2071 family)
MQPESKILSKTSHRPWPPPTGPWSLTMRWHDLLFLHWPVQAELIRPLIPEGLELDTFDGSAWIGIVAFRMSRVRPRHFPRFAALAFPEISVRTYVWSPGRSGVWFFSLEAANRLAVRVARMLYRLPSYDARITVKSEHGTVHYTSSRIDRAGRRAEFSASCRPTGSVYRSAPETIDRWVTDRYCLYAMDRADRLGYVEIHHAPWPLQLAQVDLRVNTMAQPLEIDLPSSPPLAHFAGYLEVVAWPFVRIDEG